MRVWIYFFKMALVRTCICSILNFKIEHTRGHRMSELDQFVNKSKTATSVSNTDRVHRGNKTVVDGASDNKALEMDTKRACVSANGTLDVDLCIHYIQRLIQTQLPKDIWGLDRVSRVLTELTLPICLDGLKVEHYNPESQICCNGVISNRDKHNKSCCHGEVIDNTAFLCCNDVKYERNESNGCCGTFEYDKRTKGCCGGMLHNISEKQTCCHGNTELTLPGKCCNAMSIDGSCMSCVNDTLVEITLDASTDLCCRGMGKKRSRVCSNGNLKETVTEDQERNAMSPWNNESDNRISYTIFGSVAGSAGFFSICGVAISYFKCRRRRIAYLVLKKSADYHVPKITLANYTRALESPVNHHTQAIEDTQEEVKFNSANIQFTSAGKRYAKLTNISTCPDSVVSSFASSNATDLRDFNKCSLITNENLTLELVHESHTQTITNNLECKKTIFGTPFDGTFMLDETNRTLQMHYSDAAMTLPLSMTKACQVEVSASTFRSIEATREKLGLSDDEFIASPVVEYAIEGNRKLDGYAFVRLPFVGKSTNLKVKKFESDEGLETVAKSHEIPRKDKQNEDLDTYYIVDRSAVLIYTKSFSGFYCTMCGHRRDLELIAFIFGSYKCLNNMYEVFITAYIADVLLKIEDYRKEMFENEENRQGRKCLRSEIPLGMPDDCNLDENDYIEACLFLKTDEDKRKWKHVIHPERGTPVYPPKQKIKLATIAQNCQRCLQIHTRRNTRSVQKNWYLSNNENTVPSDKFQCYIDLTVCKKDTEIFEPNCITIDELEFRETDRSRIKDSYPVQETSSLTGACAAGLSRKSSRNVGTEGDIQLFSRQSHTLVRAESEQDLMRNSSVGNGRRHIPPSPELSQAYGTTGFPAIPNIDSPEPDD